MKIGIIYIVTGPYIKFWNEFYSSSQLYFCVEAEKNYEVFTDSSELASQRLPNVHMHLIEDKGWIVNVSSKSKFICEIRNQLTSYDYIFYLNGNFKFISPIYCDEILPQAEHNYLTALSFSHYLTIHPDHYPYDRNKNCNAFIPYGQGKYYFQGGFYGGRTQEVLSLSEWCRDAIEADFNKKVIARFHDESYINRYLLTQHPKVLNDKYAFQDIWPYEGEYKAIVLNKEEVPEDNNLQEMKQNYIDPSLSFLLNDELKFIPISIVQLYGGLGNQMFGYAFYLYIRHISTQERKLLIDPAPCKRYGNHNGYELPSIFSKICQDIHISDETKNNIRKLRKGTSLSIEEVRASMPQSFKEKKQPIIFYSGCWQCVTYVETVKDEIKKDFIFDESKLNEPSAQMLRIIRRSNSVSVHIRRNDYLIGNNEFLYGGICTKSYYEKAISQMYTLLKDEPIFIYFTDDPEWVRSNFALDKSYLVDWNKNKDNWQDMYLMSACRHHIIANSSFSWWAAWLGGFPEKKVIAPSTWLNGMQTPDILPTEWIKIPITPDKKILNRICNHLILHSSYMKQLGLNSGKMGVVIFFFHYARYTQNPLYENYAGDLFDELYEEIHKGISFSFLDGLCGIAWAVEYLVHEQFIEGNTDDSLAEIDFKVMQIDPRRFTDYSFETGLEGIACYVLSRLLSPRVCSSSLTLDSVYLKDLTEACRKVPVDKANYTRLFLNYIESKEVGYSFKDVLMQVLNHSEKAFGSDGLTWQTGLTMIMR
ncbi:hypothetical protein F030043B2_31490 [Bacteroides fragilis]|uniref:alpha-1,2-fucosyltransferase n=1 Tax=Bacteroides fragilis TaxID=817 RepID=UPI001CA9127B|nr:alpha-1,2-fucosyltransferase [Bacteroides fragilis]MBY2900425.1 hypothetical protein [Bacteroides fragilis]